MNKKDCSDLGLILSQQPHSPELREAIFELDQRIEGEYLSWMDVQGDNEKVSELFEQKMIERLGDNWSLQAKACQEISSEVMEEARREVYGDDYEYIFGKS